MSVIGLLVALVIVLASISVAVFLVIIGLRAVRALERSAASLEQVARAQEPPPERPRD